MLRLKFERVKRGLSQTEVATLGGRQFSQSVISLAESGWLTLTPNQLQRIAQIFDVPADVLLREVAVDDHEAV